MDEFSLIEQFKPAPPTSVAEVLARAAAMPDRAELEEAAAQRAAEDARAEERELRRMLNARAGDPLGQLSRAESAAAALRDEVRDLEDRLAAVRARLHRAAEAVVDFRSAANEVMSVSAQRSSAPDLLAEAKRVAAELRVEEMLAARSQEPGRRPKGPGGHAVRSDQPVTCEMCKKYGATPEQSFLIRADPSPAPAPAVPSEDERDWLNSLGETAERRTPGRRYAEISR